MEIDLQDRSTLTRTDSIAQHGLCPKCNDYNHLYQTMISILRQIK